MDPVTLVIVPGFLGGLLIALLVARVNRKSESRVAPQIATEPLSPDVINMAHIKVAGAGGLGLVAMAVAVAIAIPRIGQTLALGLVLGGLFAVVLIVRRRSSQRASAR